MKRELIDIEALDIHDNQELFRGYVRDYCLNLIDGYFEKRFQCVVASIKHGYLSEDIYKRFVYSRESSNFKKENDTFFTNHEIKDLEDQFNETITNYSLDYTSIREGVMSDFMKDRRETYIRLMILEHIKGLSYEFMEDTFPSKDNKILLDGTKECYPLDRQMSSIIRSYLHREYS